ncbi:transient receptor potential cation channel protein painless-like [Planococcus citri]|uniref:transient receptor potential cation channel protein painless-like n=1 Tax=Planococcus citri TaxID=170843 RepID=UPI0031F9A131
MNQQQLLSSFKDRKLAEFSLLLKCQDVDIDYFYGDPDNGTLLDLACQSTGYSEFISILLLEGASIWRKNQITGKFALNEALANSDNDTIECLREAWKQNVTTQDELILAQMQTAIKDNDIETMRLIARYHHHHHRTTELNSKSPHCILLQGSIEAVKVFIECFDIDEEFQRDSHGRGVRTCREIILQKYPQLEPELPKKSMHNSSTILFSYLRRGAPELFLRQVNETDPKMLNLDQTEDEKTYLHVACEYNYIDVVNMLLEREVCLNKIARDPVDSNMNGTPIMIAGYKGHYEIVAKLLAKPDVELQINGIGSILHSTIHGMNEKTISGDNHRKILQLLLQNPTSPSANRLNIDFKDENDMTPLHLAIIFHNESAIRLLIHAGANLYLKDPEGKLPLTSIPASILEEYFDDCIHLEKDRISSTKVEKKIKFNYDAFRRLDQNSIETGHEMEFFARIKKVPELRSLFKHPLSKSFLYVKWCLVKKWYYVNLAFYLLFWVSLSMYIFQIQDCQPSSLTTSSSPWDLCNASCLRLITILLYIVFILRELCQFFVSIRSHFNLLENWLEFMMILVVGVFLFVNETNPQIAAIVILTSWLELVFLLGKHPLFSIYVQMFKTVALNFAKFLVLYSILVASFAYSFFILFRNEKNEYVSSGGNMNKNSISEWRDLRVSFIKSIVMMHGEFETWTLPLGQHFNYNYVFFILFVYLVTMVLYNLLHGLAVSDTQAIMEDAEVVALISRVKLISQLERLANSNPFRYIRSCWPNLYNRTTISQLENGYLSCFNKIARDQIILSSKMVSVHLSQDNKIRFASQKGNIGTMPSTIVKQAEKILEKRNQSQSAKLVDQNLPANELINLLSEQIRHLQDEMDRKISQVDEKSAERDRKLLRSVDQRNIELLESITQMQSSSNKSSQ